MLKEFERKYKGIVTILQRDFKEVLKDVKGMLREF